MARVVGEPLANCRLTPLAAIERRMTSAPASQGSSPAAARMSSTADWQREELKTASIEQRSAPDRMAVRSARWPMMSWMAPRMTDLPAPVSPVMTLRPG